jgi:hypothetical protein
MKEYGLNDIKLFRLNDGTQHCKIWFTKDGINIIPIWFKRLDIRKIKYEMVENQGYPFLWILDGMIEVKIIQKYILVILKLILLIKYLM